jgi:hypothetical protein
MRVPFPSCSVSNSQFFHVYRNKKENTTSSPRVGSGQDTAELAVRYDPESGHSRRNPRQSVTLSAFQCRADTHSGRQPSPNGQLRSFLTKKLGFAQVFRIRARTPANNLVCPRLNRAAPVCLYLRPKFLTKRRKSFVPLFADDRIL